MPSIPLGFGAGLVLVAILLLGLVPAVASGLKKTPRDRVGISYGGGPIEGSHFQRVVQPGTGLFFNGFVDPLYLYPADQRNYIVSKTVGQGAVAKPDSIVAPSLDRVQVEYQVAVYFKLNTDRLRDFHEQLGLRYSAYTDSGWDRLIQDTFRQQIESTLQEQTRRYAVADIFSSAALLVQIQNEVQKTLSARLQAALGRQFFCGPTFRPGGPCPALTFVVKRIDLPRSVVAAFELNRTSQVQIATKTNEVAQRQKEAEAINALTAAGVPANLYPLIKAIESGKIPFWVIPNNLGLTLTTPTPGSGSSPGEAPSVPVPTSSTTAVPTTTTPGG